MTTKTHPADDEKKASTGKPGPGSSYKSPWKFELGLFLLILTTLVLRVYNKDRTLPDNSPDPGQVNGVVVFTQKALEKAKVQGLDLHKPEDLKQFNTALSKTLEGYSMSMLNKKQISLYIEGLDQVIAAEKPDGTIDVTNAQVDSLLNAPFKQKQ